MFMNNFWASLEIGNTIIFGLLVISGSVDLVLPVPVAGKVELDRLSECSVSSLFHCFWKILFPNYFCLILYITS